MVEAQTMVAAAQRSIRRFSMNDREEILDFDIGCSNSLQLQLLENVLEELREMHPAIHPRIHIMREPYFTEQIEEETIDIAIGFEFLNINNSPAVQRTGKKHHFPAYAEKTLRLRLWRKSVKRT